MLFGKIHSHFAENRQAKSKTTKFGKKLLIAHARFQRDGNCNFEKITNFRKKRFRKKCFENFKFFSRCLAITSFLKKIGNVIFSELEPNLAITSFLKKMQCAHTCFLQIAKKVTKIELWKVPKIFFQAWCHCRELVIAESSNIKQSLTLKKNFFQVSKKSFKFEYFWWFCLIAQKCNA